MAVMMLLHKMILKLIQVLMLHLQMMLLLLMIQVWVEWEVWVEILCQIWEVLVALVISQASILTTWEVVHQVYDNFELIIHI